MPAVVYAIHTDTHTMHGNTKPRYIVHVTLTWPSPHAGATTEELCSRWTELGAFYTFSRNHNGKGTPSQEPYVWPSVAAISRKVLGIRYSLLPYYYTLFYKASRPIDPLNDASATVLKPLFFEFPKDSNTYSIDKQFLVGSALLISPVLELGESKVFDNHVTIMWQSCDSYVTIMWQSCDSHVTIMWQFLHS